MIHFQTEYFIFWICMYNKNKVTLSNVFLCNLSKSYFIGYQKWYDKMLYILQRCRHTIYFILLFILFVKMIDALIIITSWALTINFFTLFSKYVNIEITLWCHITMWVITGAVAVQNVQSMMFGRGWSLGLPSPLVRPCRLRHAKKSSLFFPSTCLHHVSIVACHWFNIASCS